jgi:crossover junction endodeoxyribonuclease RuvC
MDKIILGFDIGLTGAVAVLDYHTLEVLEWSDLPTGIIGKKTRIIDCSALANMIREYTEGKESVAVLESVHAMPAQGVSSVFTFGRSLGALEGVIATLGIPYQHITPQCWKKGCGLISSEKDASRLLVNSLYPKYPFTRKKDVGITDAILIAREGKRLFEK